MTSLNSARERHPLDGTLADWLDGNADALDREQFAASRVLAALTNARVTRIGVPKDIGGDGGTLPEAVRAIADVAERSLAAAFVLWGHRAYIEYLLQSPNAGLRNRLLPRLLEGSLAGATGLSNAMKFLAGIEDLQFLGRENGGRWVVTGKLPFVTNLRAPEFHVAVAISRDDRPPFIVSLASDDPGLSRSEDLDLLGLRSTNTASISASGIDIGDDRIIHDDATTWLPQIRPAFLGLQCGLSLGLARRSLQEARVGAGSGSNVLSQTIADAAAALDHQEHALLEGLQHNTFQHGAPALFRIRIALAEIVASAVALELQATGGRAYLNNAGSSFGRRWREAAFIPIITPSIVQLKTALARHPAVSA
ncbi:acyl-CoA dehydrogenase [Hyphomicrobium sp. 2TAF46]|uniref:acyl-CoA dehydrogenase n=1 Tax=Hyphomicrobium sp. 2TAF46 TaxID=3233019 RepID=UPI003F918F57